MRQFNCAPTAYVTANKKLILKFTFIKNHVNYICLFRRLKAANQYQIVNYLMSNGSFITKLDFMTYLFAYMVGTCLYC